MNGQQLGFRLPLLVVSPYTPEGIIVHQQLDVWSLLATDELVAKAGCIGTMDCTAPLPSAFFNFSMGPRAPMLFPLSDGKAVYPMALESATATWRTIPYLIPTYIGDGSGENDPFVD